MANPPINHIAIKGKINIRKIIMFLLNLALTKIEVITEKINIKKAKFILHICSTGYKP